MEIGHLWIPDTQHRGDVVEVQPTVAVTEAYVCLTLIWSWGWPCADHSMLMSSYKLIKCLNTICRKEEAKNDK